MAEADRPDLISRTYQPGRTPTQVNQMPLCDECYRCGLELAFLPVEERSMGGWIGYWPDGRRGRLFTAGPVERARDWESRNQQRAALCSRSKCPALAQADAESTGSRRNAMLELAMFRCSPSGPIVRSACSISKMFAKRLELHRRPSHVKARQASASPMNGSTFVQKKRG